MSTNIDVAIALHKYSHKNNTLEIVHFNPFSFRVIYP